MTTMQVTVISLHPRTGGAVAQDETGYAVLINRATQGVDYDSLQAGTLVTGEVDETGYMVSGVIQNG